MTLFNLIPSPKEVFFMLQIFHLQFLATPFFYLKQQVSKFDLLFKKKKYEFARITCLQLFVD